MTIPRDTQTAVRWLLAVRAARTDRDLGLALAADVAADAGVDVAVDEPAGWWVEGRAS